GVGNVPVQAHTQELREHINSVQAAVEAVANGDVDEPVAAGDRHGWLAAALGQRVEPRAPAAAQDQTQHIVHGKSPAPGRRVDTGENPFVMVSDFAGDV